MEDCHEQPAAGTRELRPEPLAGHDQPPHAGERRARAPHRRGRSQGRHLQPHPIRQGRLRQRGLRPHPAPGPRRGRVRAPRSLRAHRHRGHPGCRGRPQARLRVLPGRGRLRQPGGLPDARLRQGRDPRRGQAALGSRGPQEPHDQDPGHPPLPARRRGGAGPGPQRERDPDLLAGTLRRGHELLPRRPGAARKGRPAAGPHRLRGQLLRQPHRHGRGLAFARGLAAQGPGRGRQRQDRLPPVPEDLRLAPLRGPAPAGRPGAAAAVGQHRDQGPQVLRRALRGRAHRPRHREHHPAGHLGGVPRPRPARRDPDRRRRRGQEAAGEPEGQRRGHGGRDRRAGGCRGEGLRRLLRVPAPQPGQEGGGPAGRGPCA